MPTVTLDCPYCLTNNTCFEVTRFKKVITNSQKPVGTTHEAIGECRHCRSVSAIFFRVIPLGLKKIRKNTCSYINNLEIKINYFEAEEYYVKEMLLIGQQPEPSKASCPEHCPDNVKAAFLEAEKARIAGLFGAAASFYRKTIDRAVTPLVEELDKYNDRLMLGQKLELIKVNNLLPKIMTDWIKVVSLNGNFSLHDDDKDYTTADEILPSMEFTITLLEYLYTLPKKVNEEFEAIQSRKDNTEK